MTHDTIDFVKGILTTELNSATDNPVSFSFTYKVVLLCSISF